MAVASAAAERIDLPRPPMDPSLSKLSSDVVSDSSTSTNVSSPADTPDRNDPSSSSPNPSYKDVEIQSQAALRSEEYRQLFRLPPEEFLVQDFNCAFQENILFQGHMYVFVHYICFYSNIFGFETKKIIPFDEITSVKRAKTAGIFPNAIEIICGGRKLFFASFLSRDEAFKLINDGWVQHGNGAKEITEQQESMSESCSQDSGFVAIEKVNSSKIPINDVESDNRDEDVPTSSDSKIPSNSVSDAEVGPGSVVNTVSSEPANTYYWKPESCDAPKVSECFTKVAETKFPIKVEEFFNLYISDNAVNFIESFHGRCGDKEFRCTSWCPHEKFGYVRDVSFQHPIKIYFGAKFGSCQEAQRFRVYRNSHLVLESSQEINDVPYGDYFRVEGLWDVERDSDGPQEGCILKVYINVAFSKRTVWKGKIMQSTLEECREAYATWIDMAHELLKQNANKGGGADPSGSSTENGEFQIEREVATEEPSERSHNLSDPVRTLQMSDSLDLNQRIADLLQGSLTSASSIACLLSEFARKSYSYVKSQGHISLVLAVAFAVILLMQVSIIVLLNRPQHVHVNYPVEYIGSMGGGGGRESSAEAAAWLEKRMHHLKEEMVMVEARLQRMWHEHAALKVQLKELGLPKKHS
ncbi:hypothetical protein PTKIN_Ptkin12aG0208900 [Pterospermum kingtungense]